MIRRIVKRRNWKPQPIEKLLSVWRRGERNLRDLSDDRDDGFGEARKGLDNEKWCSKVPRLRGRWEDSELRLEVKLESFLRTANIQNSAIVHCEPIVLDSIAKRKISNWTITPPISHDIRRSIHSWTRASSPIITTRSYSNLKYLPSLTMFHCAHYTASSKRAGMTAIKPSSESTTNGRRLIGWLVIRAFNQHARKSRPSMGSFMLAKDATFNYRVWLNWKFSRWWLQASLASPTKVSSTPSITVKSLAKWQ